MAQSDTVYGRHMIKQQQAMVVAVLVAVAAVLVTVVKVVHVVVVKRVLKVKVKLASVLPNNV